MDSLLNNYSPLLPSPSDLSSSPAPSSTSTRETSPDSQHHLTNNSLQTWAIEREPGSFLDLCQSTKMNHNPFDSVNTRRSKMNINHQTGGGTTNIDLRNSFHSPTSYPRQIPARSLVSANWRLGNSSPHSPSQDTPLTYADLMSDPYSAVNPSREAEAVLSAEASPTFGRAMSELYGGESQEEELYAYCFDRGNGQYTRLIPADMLPPLQDIPALQHGCIGMQVLPVPGGLAPNGRSSNSEHVFIQQQKLQVGSPLNNVSDIQSQIDSIIASSPPPNTQKRPKIYCDKWVHEGVCAFTQQGCKYKHEMPFDKATQHSLGLFHGLPAWWKKHQAEIARLRNPDTTSDAPVAITSRDRSFTGPSRQATSPWKRGLEGPAQTSTAIHYPHASPFGPIGPPPRKPSSEPDTTPRGSHGVADQNPFLMLNQLDETGDDVK